MSENPWKNFPKDRPLKSGLYRVEYDCANHHWYQCWYWDEDAWVEENFRGFLINLNHMTNIRFKPWDDDGGCFQNGNDHVVLTVDEVFTLKQMIQWVMKSSRLSGMNKVFLEKTYNFLNKRFDKTEKSNESHT